MAPEERAEFVKDIAEALSQRYTGTKLTDEEVSYVRLAIQKESQTIKFRQAVIEKTITSLIWALIVGMGLIFLDFLKAHGFKS